MNRFVGVALLAALLAAPRLAAAQTWGEPQPPPQQNPTGLQAGGLAPPGEGATDPYASGGTAPSPEQELSEADEKDSGRGLEFFWVNGEVGFEHLGLQTFSANDLVDARVTETKQSGVMFGGGLGVRLVFITVGPRFRYARFDDWDHWTLNAELGLRIPVGKLEPYFTFGGGYATIGQLSASNVLDSDDVDITGWNLRGGGGVDFYLSKMLTVGAAFTGELLFLTRPGVDPASFTGSGSADEGEIQAVYAADGSSVGAATTLSAVIGLHF